MDQQKRYPVLADDAPPGEDSRTEAWFCTSHSRARYQQCRRSEYVLPRTRGPWLRHAVGHPFCVFVHEVDPETDRSGPIPRVRTPTRYAQISRRGERVFRKTATLLNGFR